MILITASLHANTNPPATTDDNGLGTPKSKSIFYELAGEEVLTVTIKTALDSLTHNKKTINYYPASFSYEGENGVTIENSIKVRPRGRSRRNYCDFPPLKIKFSKKELMAKGISGSHKSLKLVTHCNDAEGSKQNVMEEYLAYKIYNELTDKSLKVQLVKVKYEDTNSQRSFKRYGILIEDIDELAERLDGEEVDMFGQDLASFDSKEINMFAMFQFMIGNEDWRIPFMRNVKLIQPKNSKKLVAIPYDFDASGLVAATYAKPDADLRLKSVRQRSFMGSFKNKKEREQLISFFNRKKEAIYSTVKEFKQLNKIDRNEALKYFDAFYEIINTSSLLKKALPVGKKAAVPTDIDGRFSS
jgi:hypothetical protein